MKGYIWLIFFFIIGGSFILFMFFYKYVFVYEKKWGFRERGRKVGIYYKLRKLFGVVLGKLGCKVILEMVYIDFFLSFFLVLCIC